MATLRWRWTVGARAIEAILDLDARTETVTENGAVRSTAERGTKTEGHVLGDVVVAFDPYLPRCTLRRAGVVLSPDEAPTSKRAAPVRVIALARPLAAVAILALAAGAVRALPRLRPAPAAEGLVTHRATDGSFVARAPARLRVTPKAGPAGGVLLALEDAKVGDAVVVLARPASRDAADAWSVLAHDAPEALAALPRADGSYVETARRDDRCAGEPGAVVEGTVRSARGVPAHAMTCAFRHDDVAYVVGTLVPEGEDPARAAEVARVVETLEPTRLEAAPAKLSP